MNIFAFDPDPAKCALWLDDVRANKMVVETCQLLSSAVHCNSSGVSWPVYKMAYMGHPCTIWAASSKGNFAWLLEYLKALLCRKPTHNSGALVPVFECFLKDGSFPFDKQTQFRNCTRNVEQGVDFRHLKNVHEAYRLYICERWKNDTITLTWFSGVEPEWRTK
jgi:hypothetical protein